MEMALRYERLETVSEELFLLQTLGDDRAVEETYITGKAMKNRPICASLSQAQ